jgi:ATP-dependent Clp protease protease subunit
VDQQMPNKNKVHKFWSLQASADGQSADVYLLGEIVTSGWEWDESDTSAQTFQKDLQALGDVSTINLHVNSPGGSVFDGVAIGNMLSMHKATVNTYVDGLAASIASVIAMSGDHIFMPANAMMMIHNPLNGVWGNSSDLRKAADDLDHIGESMKQSYLNKAGDKLDEQALTNLMDNETWLSAQEAVDYGLADEILAPVNAAASLSNKFASLYKHIPENLLRNQSEQPAAIVGGGDPVIAAGLNPQPKNELSLVSKKLKILRGE